MFLNRDEAGKRLADQLVSLGVENPLVLALPRGGVPVAVPVARRLDAELDLLMVRKIGVPGQPELAAGAVVDGATHDVVFNESILRSIGLVEADFADAISEKLAEIETRRRMYLGDRRSVSVAGRNVIIVDDGIATGATVRAALKALRGRGAALVVLAIPVAAQDALEGLRGMTDRIICLETPSPFHSVGAHFKDFGQVDDETVHTLLRDIWDEEGMMNDD